MAIIADIIAAILRDIAIAQDRSNKFSAKLSKEYEKDTLLKYFPVPNALLSEFELDLKFGIEGVDIKEGGTGDPRRFSRAVFSEFAGDLAKYSIHETAKKLKSLEDIAEDPSKWRTIKDNLRKKDFVDYLTDRLTDALQDAKGSIMDSRSGLDASAALEVIKGCLGEHLFGNPALSGVFTRGKKVRNELLAQILKSAKPLLERLHVELQTLLRLPGIPKVDVIVEQDKLEGITVEFMHSIRIKAKLRNYKWVIVEEGREPELLPED